MVEQHLSTLGVVGEEKTKVLCYLVATARKMNKGLAARLNGESAIGKTNLVNRVAELIPPEDIVRSTSISGKTLYYIEENLLAHKLIIIEEYEGIKDANYIIRNLISEREVSRIIPVEKKGQGFEAKKFTARGPISYLDTTAVNIGDLQDSTRFFELCLDDSQEQTEKVHKWNKQLAGIRGAYLEGKQKEIVALHHEAQRQLRCGVLKTIIPYADLIDFPTASVRTRRDFSRFLNLIEAVAFLHQFQRQVEVINGQAYIVATLLDYELTYRLASAIFIEALSPLSQREMTVLEKIEKGLQAKGQQTQKPINLLDFTVGDICQWCNKDRTTLLPILAKLEEHKLIKRIQGGRGILSIYRFNPLEVFDFKRRAFSMEEITSPEELKERLLKQSTPQHVMVGT
jgi:DNA-binding MarR family transcriptional regulator